MKCPKCGFSQPDGGLECLKCGVIFSKIGIKKERLIPEAKPSWTDSLEVPGSPPPIPNSPAGSRQPEALIHTETDGAQPWLNREFFRQFMLQEIADLGPQIHYARAALWLLLLAGTVRMVFTPILQLNFIAPVSWLHLVNLPFHEAGHIIFTPFGRFMQVLGGSLLQTMIPLALMGGFLVAWRDPFAASVAWWWAGENLLDLAPYIYDARAGEMTLIGGITGRDNPDFHDWKNLLMWTGMLKYDHSLARLAVFIGSVMMISALCWGGLVIWRGLHPREE